MARRASRAVWDAVFSSKTATDNFTWIQRGLGLYFAARYLIIFPNSTVLLSDRGVSVPWMLNLAEPPPLVAMAMTGAIVLLGAAMQARGCRPWVLAAVLGLHLYLACVGIGSSSGAYELIGIFSLTTMTIGAALGEKSWAVRMLQAYVANIYFWAGMHKLTGGVWTEGVLIRRVLSVGWGGGEANYSFLPALANNELGAFLERGVIVGELVVPLLFVLPLRHKILPIAAAFSFHAGTAIFMDLAEFMCTPMLALGFLTSGDKALLARWWRIFSREDPGKSPANTPADCEAADETRVARQENQSPALAGRGSVDPRDSGKS